MTMLTDPLAPAMPRANPPIVIGPFTNVPAPGSPIRSDWPQQISRYVVDHTYSIQTGTQVGPGGNYPTGTDVINITIPAAAYARFLSFAYLALVGAQPSPSLDMVSTVDGAVTGTYRCQPGITQSVSIARHGVVLSAGAAHSLKVTNVGSTATLYADPAHNICSWTALAATV